MVSPARRNTSCDGRSVVTRGLLFNPTRSDIGVPVLGNNSGRDFKSDSPDIFCSFKSCSRYALCVSSSFTSFSASVSIASISSALRVSEIGGVTGVRILLQLGDGRVGEKSPHPELLLELDVDELTDEVPQIELITHVPSEEVDPPPEEVVLNHPELDPDAELQPEELVDDEDELDEVDPPPDEELLDVLPHHEPPDEDQAA